MFPHDSEAQELYFPPQSHVSLLEITSMLCAYIIFLLFGA